MQEDFLHYIWKHRKFQISNFNTTSGEYIAVVSTGQHNFNSGPDFFNAQLKIDDQLWAGNVEIHVKSSDWFLHNHEQDPIYDNVILHVVWEHDTEVFRKDNTPIPTLQLKDYVDDDILDNYNKLFSRQNRWINCENDFNSVDDFVLSHWKERLFFERLERKSETIKTLLDASKNDWEAVLFKMLAKNFGLKVNGEPFMSMAQSFDFSILRKTQSNLLTLEALFIGQSDLLSTDAEGTYHKSLVDEYNFLKQKFKLNNRQVAPVQFFRLRPPNFPTIRLSQLANLYYEHQNLFSKVNEAKCLDDFYDIFNVSTSDFWKTHYTFKKESKSSEKKLTKSFIDLLVINTILPLKLSYAKHKGESKVDAIVKVASAIKSEKNSIVEKFNGLRSISQSALDSQALIQLKTSYCDKHKCLQCAVGNQLLNK
ncbi:DUF2851 family protein [Flavisericum labens]|uniref:DUF2851 family protein n=1 Tax=Flavisericum labens TaxID=3377112 RepID=UPI00387B2036